MHDLPHPFPLSLLCTYASYTRDGRRAQIVLSVAMHDIPLPVHLLLLPMYRRVL